MRERVKMNVAMRYDTVNVGEHLGRKFSWAKPGSFGIPHWNADESPLPAACDQGQQNICIGMSLKAVIQGQVNKMAHEHGQTAPEISLQQLLDVLDALPNERKFISEMLLWLMQPDGGVVAEDDYDKTAKAPIQGSKRYRIHWCRGLDPEDVEFKSCVKKAIVAYGAVVGELKVTSTYDMRGQSGAVYRGTGKLKKISKGLYLGHAVAFTGWTHMMYRRRDTFLWEFLNSYGSGWGRDGGFGDTFQKPVHYVYVIEVAKSWV